MAKRPKRALVQFLVAALIALVIGGIGLGITVMVVLGLRSQNSDLANQSASEREKLEAELSKVKEEAETAKKSKKVKYQRYEVVATRNIHRGVVIGHDMLKEILLKDGARGITGGLPRKSMGIGQIAAEDILAGKPLKKSQLLDTEGMLPVQQGMRAMSIAVNSVGNVAGAVVAGSKVDVLATFKNMKIAKTLLQNVRVIGVGGSSVITLPKSKSKSDKKPGSRAKKSSGKKGTTVTLEVTPHQAEQLVLANNQATFHLTLRGFGDSHTVTLYGADVGQLITGLTREQLEHPDPVRRPSVPREAPSIVTPAANAADLPDPGALPAASSTRFSMEIIKGGNSETQEFEWQSL